jgi:hypothetical protein
MSNSKTKTRTVADLRREAAEMNSRGEMPTFEEVSRAIADANRLCRAKIRFERLKTSKLVQ